MVILAKSAKVNNYCIAGIDIKTNEWIRPVSDDPNIQEAVRQEDVIFSNKTAAEIFDVVDIHFKDETNENLIQPENLYYDENYKWKKIGNVTLKEVISLHGLDHRKAIFYGYERSMASEEILNIPPAIRESLLLIPVENMFVNVEYRDDCPRFYADFTYKRKIYKKFSIGDIAIRNRFKDFGEGNYFLAQNVLVVFSLTNPFHYDSRCYKMVAQIF